MMSQPPQNESNHQEEVVIISSKPRKPDTNFDQKPLTQPEVESTPARVQQLTQTPSQQQTSGELQVRELDDRTGSEPILIRSRSRDSPFKTFEGPGGTPRMTYGNPFDTSPASQPQSAAKDRVIGADGRPPLTREFSFTPAEGPGMGIKVSKAGPDKQIVVEEVKGFSSMNNSAIESEKGAKSPRAPSAPHQTEPPKVNQPNVVKQTPVDDPTLPRFGVQPLPPRPSQATTIIGTPIQHQVVRTFQPGIQHQASPSIVERSVSPPPQRPIFLGPPTQIAPGQLIHHHPQQHHHQLDPQRVVQQFPPGGPHVHAPIQIRSVPSTGLPPGHHLVQPINQVIHHLVPQPTAQLPNGLLEKPPTRILRGASQGAPSPIPLYTGHTQNPLQQVHPHLQPPNQQRHPVVTQLFAGLVPQNRVTALEEALRTRDSEILRLHGLLKTRAVAPQTQLISSETGNIPASIRSTTGKGDLQTQVQKLIAHMEEALQKQTIQKTPVGQGEPTSGEDRNCVISEKQVLACLDTLRQLAKEQPVLLSTIDNIEKALARELEERKKWQDLGQSLLQRVKQETKKRKELEKLLVSLPTGAVIPKLVDLHTSFGDPWHEQKKNPVEKNPYSDSLEDRPSSFKPNDPMNMKNPYRGSSETPQIPVLDDVLGALGRRLHTAFGGSNPYDDSEPGPGTQKSDATQGSNPFAFGSMIGGHAPQRHKQHEPDDQDVPFNPIRLTIAKNNLVYGSMVEDQKPNEFSGNTDSPDGKRLDSDVQKILHRTSAIVVTDGKFNQSPERNRQESRPSSTQGYYGAVSEYPVARPARNTNGDYRDSYYEDDGKVRKFSLTPPPPEEQEDSIVVPVNMSDGNPHTNDGHLADPKADMIKPLKINSVDNSEKELHVMSVEDYKALREELERLQKDKEELEDENSNLKRTILRLQEELGESKRGTGCGSPPDRPSPREKLSINVEAALQFAKIRETHEKSEIIGGNPPPQGLYSQKVPPTITEVSKDDFGLSYSLRPKSGFSQLPLHSEIEHRDRMEDFHNNPSFGNPSAFMLPNGADEMGHHMQKQTAVSFFGGDRSFPFAQADFYPAESKTEQSSGVSPKETAQMTADTTVVGRLLLGQLTGPGSRSAGHLFKENQFALTEEQSPKDSQSYRQKEPASQSDTDLNRRRELSVELSHKTAELASLRSEIATTQLQLAQISLDREQLSVGNKRMQAELAKMARILKQTNKDKAQMAADIHEMKELVKGLVIAQTQNRGPPENHGHVIAGGNPGHTEPPYHRDVDTMDHRYPRTQFVASKALVGNQTDSPQERQELADLYRSEWEQFREQRDQIRAMKEQKTQRKLGLRERLSQLQQFANDRQSMMNRYYNETDALGTHSYRPAEPVRRNLLHTHGNMQQTSHAHPQVESQTYYAQEQPEYEQADEDYREEHTGFHLETEDYGQEEERYQTGAYSTPPRESAPSYHLDEFADDHDDHREHS